MASSYTTNFGIEEMATGDQSGDWGTTTNFNFDILDRITAYKAVALSDASTATLTVREASPGSGTENLQDGMFRVIKFTGSLSQNCTITIAPNTTTAYFVFIDGTSGGFSLIFSQGTGDNYTLASGTRALVYCDGGGSDAIVAPALVEPLTTRGDIVVRNASNLTARLGVGSANYVVLTDGTDVAWGQVSLTAGVTGTLPTGNGGTGSTSTTYCSLTSNISGTLPTGNGGTGSTSTTYCALGTNVSGTLPTGNGGTGSTSTTYCALGTNVSGTLPIGNGGTGATTLTANYALLGNGSSAPQMIAPGSSGNVLTSDGSTWASAAAGGGGGAWAVKASGSFTDVSELAITGLSKTTVIEVTITDDDGENIYMRVSTDNGSSYKTDSNYKHAHDFLRSNDPLLYSNSNSETYTSLGGSGGTDGWGFYRVYLPTPATSMRHQYAYNNMYGKSSDMYQTQGMGGYNSEIDIDAIKIYTSAGNDMDGAYIITELN